MEREAQNLDPLQSNQVQQKRGDAEVSVQQRIAEAYRWLLVPLLSEPTATSSEWVELSMNGQGTLVERALRKLVPDHLATEFGGSNIRYWLNRVLWREKDHVEVGELAEQFAQYLYLPRLRDTEVLLSAVQLAAGLPTWEQDSFALADGWDEEKGRYRGLRIGQSEGVSLNTLLVKPEIALAQLRREKPPEGTTIGEAVGPQWDGGHVQDSGEDSQPAESLEKQLPRRFYGTVQLDPQRLSRDVGQVAQEVVQHLAGQVGAQVAVTLEIEAHVPEGASDHIVRTVSENSRTLGFQSFGFEDE